MPRHRTRRSHKPWGRNQRLEMVVSAIVLVGLIATALVFIFVLHDFPFRVS